MKESTREYSQGFVSGVVLGIVLGLLCAMGWMKGTVLALNVMQHKVDVATRQQEQKCSALILQDSVKKVR
jgi:hypothetical protein